MHPAPLRVLKVQLEGLSGHMIQVLGEGLEGETESKELEVRETPECGGK